MNPASGAGLSPGGAAHEAERGPTSSELGRYFLKLGAAGFGGPIALAGAMQRDLVERRRWFSKQDYAQGLALAQLAPGPLAAQLAIYLGWVHSGLAGATLVAAAFILPSFLMVLAIASCYVHYGGLPWMQGMFYGIGASVIAMVARSAFKLMRTTLGGDRALWAIFLLNALATAWTEREVVWMVVASGAAVLVARGGWWRSVPVAALVAPAWLVQGLQGAASWPTLLRLVVYFGQAGVLVFGSGLAIVPFLRGGVVDHFHWLSDRQFLDAMAVAMITPGPVVITVAFIGFLVAGLGGAIAAAIGVFLPCYGFVVLLAPRYRRIAGNPSVQAFVAGVTAAACGAIAGAAVVLGRRAIVDLPTAFLATATLITLVRFRRIPEPILILAAGAAGLTWKLLAR